METIKHKTNKQYMIKQPKKHKITEKGNPIVTTLKIKIISQQVG